MYQLQTKDKEKEKYHFLLPKEKREIVSDHRHCHMHNNNNNYKPTALQRFDLAYNENYNIQDLRLSKRMKIDSRKNKELREKVSIFEGDITKLEVDAIVNSTGWILVPWKCGVDHAIHKMAGSLLYAECLTLGGCQIGEAKITASYRLPCKYVIHTNPPKIQSSTDLESCYENSLAYRDEYDLKSIGFPCIGTGLQRFPNRQAAHIALGTVRKFLESNEKLDKVIFCTFLTKDTKIYESLLPLYFPM